MKKLALSGLVLLMLCPLFLGSCGGPKPANCPAYQNNQAGADKDGKFRAPKKKPHNLFPKGMKH